MTPVHQGIVMHGILSCQREAGGDHLVSHAELQQLVAGLVYKPGWVFAMAGGWTFSNGPLTTPRLAGQAVNVSTGGSSTYAWPDGELLTLVIEIVTPDSGDPSRTVLVQHRFTAPPWTPSDGWRRWVLEQILAVERHEACEFFQIGSGRPFYPQHGPGADLYAIRERVPAVRGEP